MKPRYFVLSRPKVPDTFVWALRHECCNLDQAVSRIPQTRKLRGDQWWLIAGVEQFDSLCTGGHISFVKVRS